MKTYLDCIPCFFRQALMTARLAGADDITQREVLNRLSQLIPTLSLELSPPHMSRAIYGLVREITGREDVYKEVKEESNRIALDLYPELKEKVKGCQDRLLAAVRIAITGNIIDYGVPDSFDIRKEVGGCLNEDFAICDYEGFKDRLKDAEKILYLGDNAGEIVFDKVLIEELRDNHKKKEIIFAVRDKPVINDALIEDAKFCGIDKIAKVISNGSDAAGTLLDSCSENFLDAYRNADMIISKGQGNFESLTEEKRPIFFLFKAKCAVVARDIGCSVGGIILKGNLRRVNSATTIHTRLKNE